MRRYPLRHNSRKVLTTRRTHHVHSNIYNLLPGDLVKQLDKASEMDRTTHICWVPKKCTRTFFQPAVYPHFSGALTCHQQHKLTFFLTISQKLTTPITTLSTCIYETEPTKLNLERQTQSNQSLPQIHHHQLRK